jgi:hypothetical protein
VTLKATLMKNMVSVIDSIRVAYQVDNAESNLAAKEVECHLLQKVRLTSNEGKSCEVNSVLARSVLPGVEAGTSESLLTLIEIKLPSTFREGLPLFPTSKGEKVEIAYDVEVIANFGLQAVKVVFPVEIFP